VTPPRRPGLAGVVRSPVLALIVPGAVILLAATLTPASEFSRNQGDVALYLGNARAIFAGVVPYRDLPLEYPPLALVPMLVPYLAGLALGDVTVERYARLFAGWEALLVVLLGIVLLGIARRGRVAPGARDRGSSVAWRLPLLVAGAALAIAWRFDLFAALLLAGAVWATLAKRPTAAGVLLGLGVLTKLFPIVAMPALAVTWLAPRDDRGLIRFCLATGLTVALGMAPFLALAGTDALSFLGYQGQRGLEIESIGAGIVLLDGLVRGQPVETHSPFKAVEVFGPLAEACLRLLPVLTIAGFGALAVAGWRRVRLEAGAPGGLQPATVTMLTAATVLVLLVTSKVFSIQYVVWLVPFAALLPTRKFWLAAVAIGLTMPIHPFLFIGLVNQQALPVVVLNLRNALLVMLTAWIVVDLARGRAATPVNGGDVARPAGLEPTTFRSAT
jgi:hypothetical protein